MSYPQDGGALIAGVDEAGRGPLAGPVVAAAVILDPEQPIAGLADSKQLSAKCRERLAKQIKRSALGWSIARAEAEEIDRINILQASLLAMQRAVSGLAQAPTEALIDGNRCPQLSCRARAIVKGDSTVAAISAASILAKVERDRLLTALHLRFPQYGFRQHKGYPTRAHLNALTLHGACPQHRRSFAPVKAILELYLSWAGTGQDQRYDG